MAEGKKTFIFYSDWINMVREMDNEDAGELLKHILRYVNDEKPETKNKFVKMAFGHMKPLIKSDLVKWQNIRAKRKEAGAKGGKANAKQNQANAKQVEAVNDNVNVSTYVDYSESDFLINWNQLREHYLKTPSNLNRLITLERDLFNDLENNFTKEDYHNALLGLFKQERVPANVMWFKPKHFLENKETYLDAELNKNYKLYV